MHAYYGPKTTDSTNIIMYIAVVFCVIIIYVIIYAIIIGEKLKDHIVFTKQIISKEIHQYFKKNNELYCKHVH